MFVEQGQRGLRLLDPDELLRALEHILGPAMGWRRHDGGRGEMAVLTAWSSASDAAVQGS